jgi:hypothetical protein
MALFEIEDLSLVFPTSVNYSIGICKEEIQRFSTMLKCRRFNTDCEALQHVQPQVLETRRRKSVLQVRN